MPITLDDIKAARARIGSQIQVTPVSRSRSVSERLKTEIFLKLENQQTTGSFKVRGSLNKMLCLSREELNKGIVACSAGNHAQGVAFAATHVGAKSNVVMPETAPLAKVLATQRYGANVILHGRIYDDSYQHARELEQKYGYTFVHPFEDPLIIAGQGTLGMELLEQIEDLDSVIMPIGGGGLMSGAATALKTLKPSIRIFGVVSTVSPGMLSMFRKQTVAPPTPELTIADGISVKRPSEFMYKNYISRLVDDIVDVADEAIAESIVYFLERAKTLVEGSGAVCLAGAEKAGWDLGKRCALVLSGGNIDLNMVSKVIERGLSNRGRLIRIRAIVPDRPGSLMRLANTIAQKGANILDVLHDRVHPAVRLSETSIEFLLETRGVEHAKEVQEALREAGARIVN